LIDFYVIWDVKIKYNNYLIFLWWVIDNHWCVLSYDYLYDGLLPNW